MNSATPTPVTGLSPLGSRLPADRPCSRFTTEWEIERTAGTASGAQAVPLFLVVGFDGTEPAERALDGAVRLLHDREGALEIVYVAHVPDGATLPPTAMVEVRNRFDDLTAHLASDVRSRLGDREPRWHFQRRDGTIAQELTSVADDLRRQHGPEANVAMIVGDSAHKQHRVLGSVAMNLQQVDRFPVMVVP